MRKIFFGLLLSVGCFLSISGPAEATCKGNFRLEFGHTNNQQWVMQRDSTCNVILQFDYVALYGLSVRQQPRNGTIRMVNAYTYAYVPRKGFTGQDTFIVDADGGYVDWQSGKPTLRAKAGMAVTMTVQ